MKKSVNNKSKINLKKKILVGIIVLIVLILILLGYMLFFRSNNSGLARCETDEYNIDEKILKKAEKEIKTIEQVDSVKIYKNVCILKIIVNLKEDVEIDTMKEKMKSVIEILGTDITNEFDISLFVTSDNEESEVYPINVSKHKSREDFAW